MDAREFLLYAVRKGYSVDLQGEPHGPKGPLAFRKVGTGYRAISVKTPQGRVRNLEVHRLAAYQKFGEALFDAQVVRHLDGNYLNNCADNLALGTYQENSMDRPSADRKRSARIAASALRKYDDHIVRSIREDRARGSTYKYLTAKYNIPKSTLSYLLTKATY